MRKNNVVTIRPENFTDDFGGSDEGNMDNIEKRIEKLESNMEEVKLNVQEIKTGMEAAFTTFATHADVERMGQIIIMWNVGTMIATAGIVATTIFAILRYSA